MIDPAIYPTRGHRGKVLVAGVIATALFTIGPVIGPALIGSAWAQSGDTAATAPSEITTPQIKELEAKLATFANRVDLTAAELEQITSAYRMAIDQHRLAEQHRLKTQYVEQLLAEAPDKRAAIQLELDATPPPADSSIVNDATFSEITARIAELEAELTTQRNVQAKLEGEISHRAERRAALPRDTSEANQRADVLRQTLATLPAENTETNQATRERIAAEIAENEARAALHSKELFSYDGRRALLATRRDLAALKILTVQNELTIWRQALAAERRAAGEEASRAADEARETATSVDPVLRDVAAQVAYLAAERAANGGLAAKLTKLELQLASLQAAEPAMRKRFDDIRAKAAVLGYTNAIGALLRKEKQELPEFSPRAARMRQTEIADTQFRMIELEELRRNVGSVATRVETIMATVDPSVAAANRASIAQSAHDLVTKERDYLDDLIDNYDKYFLALVELDNAEKGLMQEASHYERYIEENVLWIRNAKALTPMTIPNAVSAALWLGHPRGWVEVAASFYRAATQQPGFVALATALLALLFYYQPRLRRFVRETGTRARNARDERARDAVAILGATLLLAFAWPALLNVASYVMITGHDERSSNLVVALGAALAQVAAVGLTVEFLRQICRAGGIAETHLSWSRARIEAIRLHTSWALPTGALALLVALIFENHGETDFQNSLGRIAFITSMVVLALFANRVLIPVSRSLPLKTPALPSLTGGAGRFSAIAAPIMLALFAASGWYFSSLQLAKHLPATAWLLLTIAIADRLILRWLRLAELRLRREHARAAMAEARKREERKTGDALMEQTEAAEDLVNVAEVSAQTRQLVRIVLGVIAVVGLLAIWGDVLPAFRLLDRFELWTVGGSVVITLSDLLVASFCFAGATVAARNVPGFLEIAVLQRLPIDAGVRYATRAISRYLIAITGTMFGFAALGLTWSDVQWLVAAMTVGLGFGLQEIFANFVSGIILLFERPIRVGDTVTLGTTTGTVSKIQTRATTIMDFDRKELIVPNKEFITGQLINWSLSDDILRVVLNVGIAYGSDVELAESTLLEVAKECTFVMKSPEPSVLFEAFGSSSLDLQLRVFIANFDDWLRTRHALHKAIDARFREAGIEISFPQRDLHLRTVDGAIPVRMESPVRTEI